MSSEYSLVFCLCLCVLFGLTYESWLAFDVRKTADPQTYWGLAHFDLEQSVVRKYRVLEPFAVAAISKVLLLVIRIFRPGDYSGEFSLKLGFYLFNLAASSAFCTLCYAYARSLSRSRIAALIATVMIVTANWTAINTYACMVDALFCCFVALTFLGISSKNAKMLFWAILIGPFTKESFIFLLPIIFFFSHIPKLKLIGWFALSGGLILAFRLGYDYLTGHQPMESLGSDGAHFTYIISNSQRLLEAGFMNPLIAEIGLWILVPLGGILLIKGFARRFFSQVQPYMILWLLLVVLQMLMSGDFARMFYLFMPVYAAWIAYTVDEWRAKIKGSANHGTLS